MLQLVRVANLRSSVRLLYGHIPGKRHLFRLLRAVYTPSPELYQHFWFAGLFSAEMFNTTVIMTNRNSKLETQLFWGGVEGYEEGHSLRLWAQLCRGASTILDIGANTGLFSLVAKAMNPKATVHAFEPIERIAQVLQENCEHNRFEIAVHVAAVSDTDGEAVIYDLPLSHHYVASLHEDEAAHHYGGPASELAQRRAPTVTLARFIEEQQIARVDLMKVDVEGHEVQVLAGMGAHLHKMQPTMLLEVKNSEHASQIGQMFQGCDYQFYDIDERTRPMRIDGLRASTFRNILVCAPDVAHRLGLDAE